jgi:CO/xanthine dehydrogenase FAD-binding subunit
MHAILGASGHCIATHASDLAVALVALDAIVHLQGRAGERSVPLTAFYIPPGDTPEVENVLAHGELITAVEVPLLPEGARSLYLKVRDRASYEFALTSAAVAMVVQDGVIREAGWPQCRGGHAALRTCCVGPRRARQRSAPRRRRRWWVRRRIARTHSRSSSPSARWCGL